MNTTLKEVRTARGLSQEELARLVGVRRETIVFLEKGKYNPSLRLAYRVARVLKAKMEDLFSFDDEDWTPEI